MCRFPFSLAQFFAPHVPVRLEFTGYTHRRRRGRLASCRPDTSGRWTCLRTRKASFRQSCAAVRRIVRATGGNTTTQSISTACRGCSKPSRETATRPCTCTCAQSKCGATCSCTGCSSRTRSRLCAPTAAGWPAAARESPPSRRLSLAAPTPQCARSIWETTSTSLRSKAKPAPFSTA